MKRTNLFLGLLCFSVVLSIFSACKKDDTPTPLNQTFTFEPGADNYAEVQEALITMENGDTLRFKAGTYNFNNTLSVDSKNGIVIIGAGMANTTLNFAGQTAGAEGIKVSNCNQFIIADLNIQDTEGDAIKANDCNGISFLNMSAIWSGEADENNGAYGLYPVTSQNVLIDGCYVKGASDAGIYVGQSEFIHVTNSTVENNVAGIEIENCNSADVFGNTARHNTGGILVFDLPGLTLKNGSKCRVFDNMIIENDYKNFAPAGNIVGNVPPGTGIMLLAAKDVEIFNNTITENNILGVGVINYPILEMASNDPDYVEYCSGIYVHDNSFSSSTDWPAEPIGPFDVILVGLFSNGVPDIIYDGIEDPNASGLDEDRICVGGTAPYGFANIDAANNFANVSEDTTPFECSHTPLPVVTIDAPRL